MNHSVLYIPSLFRRGQRSGSDERPVLEFTKDEFLWPVLFMVSLSLTGGRLYPMILFVLVILLRQFRRNSYDFAIMSFFLFGGYSIMPGDVFPVKFFDLAIFGGLLFAVLLRKPPIMRRVLLLFVVFVVVMFWIALQSWESMRVQMLSLRFYFGFIAVFIPLAIFAGKPFDIRAFVHRFAIYLVIVCAFTILDGLIVKAPLFIPGAVWGGAQPIWHLRPHPFSLSMSRVYPHALVFVTMVLVPAMRMYRIPLWIWGMVVVSALATQTFTYLTALFGTILLYQGSKVRILKIGGAMLAGAVLLYLVDCMLPMHVNDDYVRSSTLRIRSTVDQFVDLTKAYDDEDVAEFGSGRMAQAIPKLELVSFYHRQWIGLGFLHKDYSKSSRFQLQNEYYSDETQADETATGIEIIPLQIYISGGWLALIAMNVLYFGLWFIIRRLKYCYIYSSTWVFVLIMGIGGFASPTTFPGAQLLSFSFAAVILANRKELPGFSDADK